MIKSGFSEKLNTHLNISIYNDDRLIILLWVYGRMEFLNVVLWYFFLGPRSDGQYILLGSLNELTVQMAGMWALKIELFGGGSQRVFQEIQFHWVCTRTAAYSVAVPCQHFYRSTNVRRGTFFMHLLTPG